MFYKNVLTAGLLISGLFLFACTTTNPRYAQIAYDKGRTYETARFNQILNPEAGMSVMPIKGIDGQVADSINKKYQDDFKVKAPATQIFNLNL